MNTIQKIMNILMKPNATLTSIISIPCTLIEIIIYVNMCLVLLNIETTKKRKYLCIAFLFIASIGLAFFIPSPYNSVCNTLMFILAFVLFFKTSILGAFIGFAIPFMLTALLEMISSQIYTLISNKPYAEAISLPLYHIAFLMVVYTCLTIMLVFFKHFKINTTLFTNLNKKDYFSILSTVILGFVTIFLQLYITAFYNNILPGFIILLSIMCLVAYVFVSIFNIIKTKQLEVANRDIKNLTLYNNTLKIMYDNIRAFKHDFHNIFNECKNLNNLSAINPEIINNPSIYAILADKYNKANLNNIQFELGVFIDLNSLHIDTYEFTRILGILLDNSIEAAQECSKKYINVRFLMDYRRNRQLVIVENTYNEKDIDTFKIFEKSYSTKPNNTGLGLWKVNKILNKHDNLAIFTSKDDELFKQQLEIYLPKPSLLKI